jgi:hypothetical protein
MAEHSINLGHDIQFKDTRVLATVSRRIEYINREAIEIKLHPSNMNREEGFSLIKSWKPLLQALEGGREE